MSSYHVNGHLRPGILMMGMPQLWTLTARFTDGGALVVLVIGIVNQAEVVELIDT